MERQQLDERMRMKKLCSELTLLNTVLSKSYPLNVKLLFIWMCIILHGIALLHKCVMECISFYSSAKLQTLIIFVEISIQKKVKCIQ